MSGLRTYWLALGLALFGGGAAAEQIAARELAFDIPAQHMRDALHAFGRQAGLSIAFYDQAVGNLESQRLVGNFTPEAALSKLLANTELTYEYINDSTVAIRPANQSEAITAREISAAWREGLDAIRLAQADAAQSVPPTRPNSSTDTKAAPALEEIIVTAEKRQESIQSLPIAISAFSGEMLTDRGISGIENLQQVAPSLQYTRGEDLNDHFAMRGISTEVSNIAGEPSIAVSQDGVSYSMGELARLNFMDIERVEVLRGPQGTIQGRNATAGAVNIISKRPTEDVEGGLKATIGNYDRLAVEGYLSGPILKDRLLGRLAVRSDRAEGWVDVTNLGEKLGSVDQLQARASFLAQLTDNFEAVLILEGMRDHSTTVVVDDGRIRPDVPSLPEFVGAPGFDRNRHTVQQDESPNIDTERYQVTLNLGWNLGPSARLTSTTGYVDLYNKSHYDIDGTLAPALVWDETIPLYYDIWQVSEEVTLTADLTDRLDVIVGGLYTRNEGTVGAILGLPLFGLPPGAVDTRIAQDLTSWAGYTQWRYRLTDDIRLTAGIRYTHDSKSRGTRDIILNGPPDVVAADGSWDAWTPRFAADYAPNDDMNFYASVSRGYKAGGFTGSLLNTFEPEFVWNFEAGVKASWLDNRLKTALTGFYMDYDDLQQEVIGLSPDPFAGTETINAPGATIQGVELELDTLLTDRFRVTFGGTWLDATYDELRSFDPLFPELGVPGPAGVNVRDLAGNQLVRAPNWQFNLSGAYTMPLTSDWQAVLRGSYAYQDKIFFSIYNNDSIAQGRYGLVNLSAAIETSDGAWQLSAYVYNLTDEFYRTHILEADLSPVRSGSPILGPPRTYGISFAHRF